MWDNIWSWPFFEIHLICIWVFVTNNIIKSNLYYYIQVIEKEESTEWWCMTLFCCLTNIRLLAAFLSFSLRHVFSSLLLEKCSSASQYKFIAENLSENLFFCLLFKVYLNTLKRLISTIYTLHTHPFIWIEQQKCMYFVASIRYCDLCVLFSFDVCTFVSYRPNILVEKIWNIVILFKICGEYCDIVIWKIFSIPNHFPNMNRWENIPFFFSLRIQIMATKFNFCWIPLANCPNSRIHRMIFHSTYFIIEQNAWNQINIFGKKTNTEWLISFTIFFFSPMNMRIKRSPCP